MPDAAAVAVREVCMAQNTSASHAAASALNLWAGVMGSSSGMCGVYCLSYDQPDS